MKYTANQVQSYYQDWVDTSPVLTNPRIVHKKEMKSVPHLVGDPRQIKSYLIVPGTLKPGFYASDESRMTAQEKDREAKWYLYVDARDGLEPGTTATRKRCGPTYTRDVSRRATTRPDWSIDD